jgi:serine/threonine-protein kinase RsbW
VTALALTARVFAGCPEQAGQVRRWVRAVAAAACPSAVDDVELAAAELVTNAIQHSRSGQLGGTVVVAVAASWHSVTIHVHDLGTGSGQVPRPRPPAADAGGAGLAEGGRGLAIVGAVSAEWGILSTSSCPARGPKDPAAAAAGCCTWCRLVPRSVRNETERGDA